MAFPLLTIKKEGANLMSYFEKSTLFSSMTLTLLLTVFPDGKEALAVSDYRLHGLDSFQSSIAFSFLSSPTINNLGEVAYVKREGGRERIIVTKDGFNKEEIFVNSRGLTAISSSTDGPVINDRSDVVFSAIKDGVDQSLWQFSFTDRSTTRGNVFPRAIFGSGAGSFKGIGRKFSLNNNGQVAFTAFTTDNRTAIVFNEANISTVIDSVDLSDPNNTRINYTNPDLNDAGVVAFKALLTAPLPGGTFHEAVFTDQLRQPAQLALILPSDEGSVGVGPSINNAGIVAGQTPGSVSIGRDGIVERKNVIPNVSGVGNIDLNNFGQVLTHASPGFREGGIFLDEQPLLEVGDRFVGGPITNIRFIGNGGFNDLGQAVFLAETVSETTFQFRSHIIRADPAGSTPDFSLQPIANPSPGLFEFELDIINNLGVSAPIYLDPIVATGFEYSIGAGGEHFASILIPEALPNGDDSFIVEFEGLTETVIAGEPFSFTNVFSDGVSEFTINGIDISEGVDPNQPFLSGVTFVNGGFSSVLSMNALTFDTDGGGDPAPIPEPSTLVLFGTGFAGLIGWRYRKKRLP